MKSKIQTEKLLILARHLEKGKLSHRKFDFAVFHRGTPSGKFCGSAGCAIGECPAVFPNDWGFIEGRGYDFDNVVPGLRDSDNTMVLDDARKFFGLNKGEVMHLFLPDFQNPAKFGGRILDENASPRQVARNIRTFVRDYVG